MAGSNIDNEVNLKRVLRVFRNAIVGRIRERLRARFGATAEAEVAALFGKKEAGSDVTQWQRMKINADRARASPEVSTAVTDDFELLGISDFYNLFDKFFTDLGRPAPAAEEVAVFADRKKGLLRCLQQIKVFRDPNAHDVSEPIDADSLLLCVLNCKKVCLELELPEAHKALEELQRETAVDLVSKHATLIRISDETEALDLAKRCLAISGASVDSGIASDLLPGGQFDAKGGEIQNCVILVASTSAGAMHEGELTALSSSLVACERNAIVPLLLISHRLEESRIEASLQGDALRVFGRSDRVAVLATFEDAIAAKLNRLLRPGARRYRRAAAVSAVVAAHAVHDDKLGPILFGQMRDPQLKVARIVAPFATDLDGGALGLISTAMIDAKKRGCRVCLITRPPAAGDADVTSKKRLLQLLHDEQIELYLNPKLHAKVYLFEREAERKFWAVGSHNMTNSAHAGQSLETSMVGYRKQEFEEAQTSFEKARRHADTLNFDAWTTKRLNADSFPS
ncbi:hypothetical protein DBR12_11730 [Acidovorax sp. HMWF029]|uniref:phospholipase D-like domain-containing protein n=1 Tax=Acidovorax sp. HMWF029 TaxID=2056863 RepID=UPI000D37FF78|nr:phospholipase D-like domain-containing protein [Acidovorax sp. HMWF029]PTT19666.1 hypothetical protein DBR12_11730 [Acidovorax sp. HMWF029]